MEILEVFKLRDAVVVEVEDIQRWKSFKIFYLLDVVLAKDEHSEVLHRRNRSDFRQLVQGQVEEGEIWQTHKIVDLGDFVLL